MKFETLIAAVTCNGSTEEFIHKHRTEDVRRLALQMSKYPDMDAAYVLDQIRGWQIACAKLPTWAAADRVVYPPHLSMEQCSSEATALYKARLAVRLAKALEVAAPPAGGQGGFVDITGGFGVDFSFISSALQMPSVYVERNESLCALAHHNFPRLGIRLQSSVAAVTCNGPTLPSAEIVCGDGVDYAHSLENAAIVLIDPARRDQNGARTYGIEDCTPNILELLPMLMAKTDFVMIKLSPMLDWHSAVRDIDGILDGSRVSEVHIVSVANECKELVLVVSHSANPLSVTCVNDGQIFTFRPPCPPVGGVVTSKPILTPPAGGQGGFYLLEPNASLMKAGCFNAVAARYNVKVMAQNSHLLVSAADVEDFPGRRFFVDAVSTMNKKELRAMLAGIDKANIAVRNFPMSVADLRKKLKLRDGGDIYLFATTTAEGERIILRCSRVVTCNGRK